jgi:biopolymer transport protein ExbD
MKFIQHKRRTAPAVIIVALIDVLIVLVIFLLCTTTFRQQPALKLALPESTTALKSGANENPPVLISIEANGTLRYGISGDVVTAKQLEARLIKDAENARSKKLEARLAVRADTKAPWGQMVKVMDIAKTANIKVSNAYMKAAGEP